MKLLTNILVGILFLTALWGALLAGSRTGNYLGSMIVLAVIAIYAFFETPSNGDRTKTVAKLAIFRFMFGLIILCGGIIFIYLGFSEFSKPVKLEGVPYLLGDLLPLIRQAFGSLAVSLTLWGLGAFGALTGVRIVWLGIKKLKPVHPKL
jgi:hypothetical protein